MSQYPFPHQPYAPPPLPYEASLASGSYHAYLARFSRAGMLLLVLGGLMLSCGGLCAGISQAVPWDQLLQEAALHGAMIPPEATPAIMRTGFMIFGIASLVFGIIQVVLGIFVRKGGLVATILAIVCTSLLLAACLFVIITGVLGVARGENVSPGGMIMFLVPTALFTLSLVWLAMAAKGYSGMQMARAQYQAQYWQYMQAQQGYIQSPSGVPQPPPGQAPVGQFGDTIGPPIPPPPRKDD